MQHRLKVALAGVAVVVSVLTMAIPALASTSAGTANIPTAAQDTVAPPEVPVGVVLVGAGGLRWSDITEESAPTMFRLAGTQGAGSVTVRSVRSRTCIIDGWLTISAGRRSADTTAGYCREVAPPVVDATAAMAGDWQELRDFQRTQKYDASPGVLGDALASAGACSTAIGPGAALALATSEGMVGRYFADPSALDSATIQACPITVVDAGSVPYLSLPVDDAAAADAAEQRRAAVTAVDELVADLESMMPADYALLVSGISDSGPTDEPTEEAPSVLPPPALRVGLAVGSPYEGRWLTATSTRWTGLVQLVDITPTLTEIAGIPRDDESVQDLVGQPWRGGAKHPASSAETVEQLTAADEAAQIFRLKSGGFYQLLGVVQAVVYLGALFWMRRTVSNTQREHLLRIVRAVALTAAALPVASYLTNLTQWWRADDPEWVLWPSLIAISAAMATTAWLGPWRRKVYGSTAFVAAVTVLVLSIDVLSGSNLQHSSLLGLTPLTAGRFYGFGNIPFGIYIAALLFLCGAIAGWLRDRGATARAQALATGGVGLAGVFVIGAPNAGADFGGVLASIPGVLILTFAVAGIALTWRRLLLIGVAAVVAVSAVSLLDWLRPAESRSHFGEFVQQIVDGSAWPIVRRKLGASLGTLDNPYSWLVPLFYVIIARLTLMKSRHQPAAVQSLVRLWPAFVPIVLAGLVTGFVGFAVNDSGLTVPAMLLTLGIPLGLAAITEAGRREPPNQRRVAIPTPGSGTGDGSR